MTRQSYVSFSIFFLWSTNKVPHSLTLRLIKGSSWKQTEWHKSKHRGKETNGGKINGHSTLFCFYFKVVRWWSSGELKGYWFILPIMPSGNKLVLRSRVRRRLFVSHRHSSEESAALWFAKWPPTPPQGESLTGALLKPSLQSIFTNLANLF